MTEVERGLLQAIFEDIDDDTPRLVYADFLEERGDPRGEFIRLQVRRYRSKDYHERGSPSPREVELRERHADEWLAEAGPFDAEKVQLQFERGFLALAEMRNVDDVALTLLDRLPGLRELSIYSSQVTFMGLGHVAQMQHLREFRFGHECEIVGLALAVLEALPFWTRVLCDGGYPDNDAWAGFQERRFANFDQLPATERREFAVRFLSALAEREGPLTEVHVVQSALSDAEMRFFREIPELEILDLYESYGVTSAGLRHLAGLPNLRSFECFKIEVDSIRPLTECPALEVLDASGYMGAVITDEGTEGLDNLTNLRVLHLRGAFGDATARRLRPLRRLRDLAIEFGPLVDERSLEALAGLTQLENLSINEYRGMFSRDAGGLSEGILPYLAPLRKLQSLKLHLGPGSGQGLRHLAGLTGLRFLQLNGDAITDAGIAHLGTLRELRTLVAQHSAITAAGADALASRLSAVTIITSDHVAKSPRRSMPFLRRAASAWASVLFPEGWKSRSSCAVMEDGWGELGSWSGGVVGPAQIWVNVIEENAAATAEEQLQLQIDNDCRRSPRVLERDLIRWPGWVTASAIYEEDRDRYLACAVARDGRSVTLTCNAPASRFEQFRPLFLLVARSVRLGDAALDGVDERIEIPVADFDPYTF